MAALAGSIALLTLASTESRPLLAQGANTTSGLDTDQDGLPDAQETVLGTDPSKWDSDGDGFSDLEELARQSDPEVKASVPEDTAVNVGIAARTEHGLLKVIIAVYMRHTETAGFNVGVGVLVNGKLLELPSSVYLANAFVDVLPGAQPGDLIGVLQTPYPEIAMHDLGSISFWSVVTPSGATAPTAADAIDLVSDPAGPTLVSIELSDGQNNMSIYRPISPNAPVASWTPGQLCEQESSSIGNIGAIVEHLVESASCELADGYCTPNCANLAGTTFQTVDPLALLGG